MKCFKYTFKSPLNGSVYCEGLVNEDENRVDFGPYGVLQLYNRDPSVLMFLTERCEDLKDCVPEELKDLVVKAEFGDSVEDRGGLYLLTHVVTKRGLPSNLIEQLMEWITGQLSDGWGESLEGDTVIRESVNFTATVFDEDTCEFTDGEESYWAHYYLHPWQYGPQWMLELVSEEEVEMDDEPTELERALGEINQNLALILLKLNQLTK